jgi:putative ABC transport system permease protein
MSTIGADKEAQTAEAMRAMENDYRIITKGLGYNILIVHKDQDLGEFLSQGYASKRMPEEFVQQLAKSEIVTIQHLLPALYERVSWPEQDGREVFLVGVRGEVPHLRSNRKVPMFDPVGPGTVRVGYVLHQALGLEPGDTLTLLGAEFTVGETCTQQGSTDDITMWIPLNEAQRILKHPGEINAIMALSCVCAEGNVAAVRNELARLLPQTQTIEMAPEAAVRYQGRKRAALTAAETTAAEISHHARLHREREALAAWLVPLVVIGSMLWIGLLAFVNARARRTEIGIWRALGFRTNQILGVFLCKAAILGFAGALLGCVIGFFIGMGWSVWDGIVISSEGWLNYVDPVIPALVSIAAPALACLASWVPSMWAAQQDPAVVLRGE